MKTESLHKNLVFQQEETNILWWVFSENSREFGISFSALEKHLAWFIAAKELDELIVDLPAPFASQAFLKKTLLHCGILEETKFTIQETIDCIPDDKKFSLTNRNDITGVEDFCPIHTAIKLSTGIGGKGDWSILFESISKLSCSNTLEPIRFSFQYFEEKLFQRFYSLVNQL